MKRMALVLFFCMTAAVMGAGCTTSDTVAAAPAYSLDEEGALVIIGITPVYTEAATVVSGINDSIGLSDLTFSGNNGDVHALLVAPPDPVAAAVLVPGAGVAAAAHEERAVSYAEEGIATLVLDVRGNGGETAGHTGGLAEDLRWFVSGKTPQWYLTIGDIVAARMMLTERFDVPVYIIGSSNGGMTGAVAAAIDSGVAGYFGVSTSEISVGDDTDSDVRAFVRSVDPGAYVAEISPAPVWLFHSPTDAVIPFENGLSLFNAAKEPKNFEAFNGTHGINPEVDSMITGAILTF
ncbi:alpha/beta hydrolase family protein [Methanogenium organophilum]|uniref:Alpha/beta hydrolase n=1 Tax=Methanogenium organophilum TaxID=2199 RepID=A0A9X9S1U1_METOG|nr:alpha/beta hydrolase [Methanogenium organophilum]WAI00287.1 alpha/beta hydrolase [Methanogenium organophilum]